MKQVVIFAIVLLSSAVSVFAQQEIELKTQKEKISYAIGANTAKNWKNQNYDIDWNIALRAMKDVMGGKKLSMTDQEINDSIVAFNKSNMDKAVEEMKKLAAKNKKEGEAFLEKNKMNDSVVTTSDGLQYKILHEGTGKRPTLEDSVSVNYWGKLVDGTEFDNSYKRGHPSVFPLSNIIKGWAEALQMMKVGSKWEVYLPSNLAYGEHGYRPAIGPNAVLIFDIELLAIK